MSDVEVTDGPDVVITPDPDATITAPPQGPPGPVGPPGPTGPATSISIGTVTTGATGSAAEASMSGAAPTQVLDLTIPQGPPGPAASLAIGTVTTGASGAAAEAHITGAAPNQVLDLTLPRGPAGPANSLSIGTVTTGAPGTNAAANITGTPPSQTLDLTIPRGRPGILYGADAPGPSTGVDGDTYIQTGAGGTSRILWGPRWSSVVGGTTFVNWGAGFDLKGETGATGATGAAGSSYAVNRFDNSGFAINQRYGAGSVSVAPTADYTYVTDRWFAWAIGSAFVTNYHARQTLPDKSIALLINRQGAARIAQRVSSQMIRDRAGKTVTVAIGYGSKVDDTLTWEVYYANTPDTFGTKVSPTKTLITSGTWSVVGYGGGARAVQRLSASIMLPAAAENGIEIQFKTTADSDECLFAAAKLESGAVATPWEPEHPAIDLERCRQYFRTLGEGLSANGAYLVSGLEFSATIFRAVLVLDPPMRAAPTVTVSDTTHWGVDDGVVNADPTSMTFVATDRSVRVQANVASGLAAGRGGFLYAKSTSSRLVLAADL